MRTLRPHLLLVGALPPPVHGSTVVSQQIKDSKAINETFRCDWVNLGTSRSMEEVGKNNPVKIFRLFLALLKEFWYLMTKHFDLCYLAITCHGSGFLKDSLFVLMCKLFRKKIIIHQHNKGMTNDVSRWPYKWLLPLCYKNAKVILLSWYLYPDIEKVVKKEDVYICPNGIRVQELTESWSMELESNRVSHLLFLSNLIESKGVLILLDALKILKDKGYSFICDFVGGETKEIDANRFNEEVKKRGLNEIAIYRGRKYGVEKNVMFRETDMFVLPTMNDCFPLVILEAMKHGKPIVTTSVGGIRDIVDDGKTGLIAKAGDPISLSDCLEKLIINSALCKQMGGEGRKKVIKEFTEDVFEDNMIKILKDVV